jgi:hypothetical protein
VPNKNMLLNLNCDHQSFKTGAMKTSPIQKSSLVVLLLSVIGAALVSALAAESSPTSSATASATASVAPSPSASPRDTCNYNSLHPEWYTFYGDKDHVGDKVSSLQSKLSEHRVFLQITQGDKSATVKLFERQKDGSFTVTDWDAKQTGKLACEIDKAIMDNKGVNCVGEQIKATIVKALHAGKTIHSVAAPETPAAAFGHSIKQAKGDFIKSTIILAC